MDMVGMSYQNIAEVSQLMKTGRKSIRDIVLYQYFQQPQKKVPLPTKKLPRPSNFTCND